MEQAPVPRAHATRTQRRLSLAVHTAHRNRRKDWAGALLLACAPPALAIGPGAITGPVNVTDGSEQVVVSGTTVTSTDS